MGRPSPIGRGRQEPLWSESDPDEPFDPDRAFHEARERIEASPSADDEGDPTHGPEAAVDTAPPPDQEISDDLPVPALDDAGDDEEPLEADGADDEVSGDATHVDGGEASDAEGARIDVDPSDPRFETLEDPRIPPERASFKIGEVARIVGVRPYVLRYWESELDFVQPSKTEAGQRRFGREDVATLLQVKRLRHDAGLTMAQTRVLIAEGRGSEVGATPADRPASPWVLRDAEAQSRVRAQLLRMREAVLDLLHAVDDRGDRNHG